VNDARPARAGLASALVVAAACGGGDSPSSPSASSTPTPNAACAAGAPVANVATLRTTLVASGFLRPVDVQAAPGDRERLYVVEQAGRVRVVRGSAIAGTFLDISARVSGGSEQGLLGLAFHPQFATNRRFFVNYTDRSGDTHVTEFRAASADAADPSTERDVLFQDQPFSNHNGGGLVFGPDGFLYIGLGDGGSGGDPQRNGQNLGTLLGKMLRIDVNGANPYAIPAGNPFVGRAGARPEIWAFGLRNPWRYAFDSATGDLYVADVGQNALEEVNVGLASRGGGENYGWNITEGSSCFSPPGGCSTAGLTMPVHEYGREVGASITGGHVYRGCLMPSLAGHYFFADFVRRLVRSFRLAGGVATEVRDWTSQLAGLNSVSSFGLDWNGEILIVDYDGELYRLGPG
jgi:glucose/arabinose dehydrogenase